MIISREKRPWHSLPVFKTATRNNWRKTILALYCAKGWFFSVKRKDKRWEFVHAYRVVQILIFHGIRDDEILAAGALHDVLENISFLMEEKIECAFGREVSLAVWILSRQKGEDEKFYFSRIGEDLDTILVKLADRLHNLRNMTKNLGKGEFFTPERLIDQIEETWEYIVPLAIKASVIGCEYRKSIIDIHEEILRSLADAEWAISNFKRV
ncbi:MAG: hypothetical protein V3574_02660 [Candidatus Moraniibacteriota bacterium]